MKIERYLQNRILLTWVALLWLVPARLQGQTIQLTDMVPVSSSNETCQDSEPNVAVNLMNPLQIAGSAFTPDPGGSGNSPLYVSSDGGLTWTLAVNLPGANPYTNATGDVTMRFGGASNVIYAGILNGSTGDLNILRTNNYSANALMTTLIDRTSVDQPYIEATTAGSDRVYVGNNNNVPVGPKTATVDLSEDAATAAPPGNFVVPPDLLETRTAATTPYGSQDGPSVRPAINLDGTIYAVYFGWRTFSPTTTTDIVMTRDDSWGASGSPFAALTDLNDGKAGQRINGTTTVTVPWYNYLGTERIGSQLSIAVDPLNSSIVYVAWQDGASAAASTLHVQRSVDRGQHWSGDLLGITQATNPALDINSHSQIGFVYQRLVNPGTCHESAGTGCWETHFRASTNGTTWSDTLLGNVPDIQGATCTSTNFDPSIGDYIHLQAIGKDFYGVFSGYNYPDTANFYTGVQYQRYSDFGLHKLYADPAHTTEVTQLSIDPYFFHVQSLQPYQDFYVRDWSDSPTSHDMGQEPTLHEWWTTSDVWNRLTNTAGSFDPITDRPDMELAEDATSGHNWAFTRVSRNAPAPSGSPDVTVNAEFLFADYGMGSAYSVIGSTTLDFAAADTAKTIADGSGVQWDLPATRSTHVCLAVEISAPNDPLNPDLAGRAPGVSDPLIVWDNNKAQRNMDLPPVSMGASPRFYALIHNADLNPRNIAVRYTAPSDVLEKLRNMRVEVIGGEGKPFRSGDSIVLQNMQPGENRWIGLSFSSSSAMGTNPLPITFEDVKNGEIVNAFTLAPKPVSIDDFVLQNMKDHRAVFNRLAVTFHISQGKEESAAADQLLQQATFSQSDYVNFLKSHQKNIAKALEGLLKAGESPDVFGAKQSLGTLDQALSAGDPAAVAGAHVALLNQFDAFQTMIQKKQGDPDDILQMVRWQRHLYSTSPKLAQLREADFVIKESDEFLANYPKHHGDTYPDLIRELLRSFHDTAESLEKMNVKAEREVDEMEDHLKTGLQRLERAHRDYLVKVQSVTP